MFKCEITGKLSRQGDPRTGAFTYIDEKSGEDTHASEKVKKIVVATRDRVYTKKVKNEETNKWEDVEVGRGFEIVRELTVTQEGADLWASWNDNQRATWLAINP